MDRIEALELPYPIPAEVNIYYYYSSIYLLLLTT